MEMVFKSEHQQDGKTERLDTSDQAVHFPAETESPRRPDRCSPMCVQRKRERDTMRAREREKQTTLIEQRKYVSSRIGCTRVPDAGGRVKERSRQREKERKREGEKERRKENENEKERRKKKR